MTIPKLFKKASGKLWRNGNKLKKYSADCCSDCEHCADYLAPPAWKIVLGDLEPNGICDKCSDYNGPYIVPKADPEYYDDCDWRVWYETPGADDGCFPAYGVFLSVNYIGGRYTINVSFEFRSTGGLSEWIYFEEDYASVKPPCNDEIDVPLTRGGPSGGGVMWTCDEALATCRITACP